MRLPSPIPFLTAPAGALVGALTGGSVAEAACADCGLEGLGYFMVGLTAGGIVGAVAGAIVGIRAVRRGDPHRVVALAAAVGLLAGLGAAWATRELWDAAQPLPRPSPRFAHLVRELPPELTLGVGVTTGATAVVVALAVDSSARRRREPRAER